MKTKSLLRRIILKEIIKMFEVLKQAIYNLVDECADELADLQHIENVARLYKEEDL